MASTAAGGAALSLWPNRNHQPDALVCMSRCRRANGRRSKKMFSPPTRRIVFVVSPNGFYSNLFSQRTRFPGRKRCQRVHEWRVETIIGLQPEFL
jgi:hypothetical protein